MIRLISIFCLALLFVSCGEEQASEILPPEPTSGLVYGIVTDAETGRPIEGVLLKLNDLEATTNAEGKYAFQDVPFGEDIEIRAEREGYETLVHHFSLDITQLEIPLTLTPLADPLEELQTFLDRLQELIEADDVANIPDIKAAFAEDYRASDDPATQFGIRVAPIPANYDDVEPSMTTLFEEYDNIAFAFQDRQFDIPNATEASVILWLHIHTEHGPRPDKNDFDVQCELRFHKVDDQWQVTFWRLIELKQQQGE